MRDLAVDLVSILLAVPGVSSPTTQHSDKNISILFMTKKLLDTPQLDTDRKGLKIENEKLLKKHKYILQKNQWKHSRG